MQVTHGTVEEIQNARVALIVATVVIAVFWRTVLRVLLAVMAAVVLVLLGLGAFLLLHAMHL